MKLKIKFQFLLILPVFFLIWLGVNYGYRYFQPMEVVDILPGNEHNSDIIVLRNPPLNEQDFIRWWLDNKEAIKQIYGVPAQREENSSYSYSISVWDIGDGYETDKNGAYKPGLIPEKYDQLCLMALPQEERCLERQGGLYARIGPALLDRYSIRFANGNEYVHVRDGNFVKYEAKEESE
ncbi:DUF943 family protein [Advenella alkanexedens]|uniref:DUF943 family protein n=1 Tax=Advenella alkanexedens TaxID=1481665 RepID=UPI0026771B50|nr:DUF943 family protein [Advenella alkanexedens]WKU19357.1 DUF943 family protein [Advenella alkanexedens]